MFKLRDYQLPLVRETIEHAIKGGAPCLVSPTGSGKTVMGAEIVRQFREWGYQVVCAAHRNEIIKQLAASCQKHCGEPVGYFTAKRTTQDRGIMVTMMPTLARRKSAIPTFRNRVLLLDEAHHIQARTYQEIIREIRPAFFVGLSATPVTPTGAGLGKYGITKLILGPQPKQLMDEGSLCKYKMFAASATVDTKGVRSVGGDFNQKDLEERILEVDGDFVRDLLRFNPRLEPTITVTVSISHAHQLAEEYSARGISAEVIIGDTPERQREDAFSRFTAGSLKVIVSVALIDEGLDLPAATCLQLVRPTRSLRLWKQLIGRVLRIDSNNPDKIALIIDHGNCWENLPLPHEPIDWTLEGKTKPAILMREVDEDGEVREAPAAVVDELKVRGNKRELKELPIESIYEQRITKRIRAVNKNLHLVEKKGFNPVILTAYAHNPEGLDDHHKRRIERALGLPYRYCDAVAAGVRY